jgi:hypothetical protein
MPITTPELGSTVATVVLSLVHVPPVLALSNVTVNPSHTFIVPVIAANGSTVMFAVIAQPVGSVYVIVVVPGTIPDTIPVDEVTVATDVLLLAHVPPVDVLPNVVVKPWQTVDEPVIVAGSGLTVTTAALIHPVLNV